MDYAGIPSWERVDALTEALLELTGLSVDRIVGDSKSSRKDQATV